MSNDISRPAPAMSRSQAAVFNLVFGYVRYAVVLVTAFVTLPLVLAQVDQVVYAKWLVAVEVLGYLAFAELGVVSILSWLVAERVGREDRDGLRRLMADVRVCGWVTISAYVTVFVAMWVILADRLGSAEDASGLQTAVLIVGIATPVSLFGRLASGVLTGFQDVRFIAAATLIGDVLAVSLTLGLVLAGAGPVGLAVGIVTPWVIVGGASLVRLVRRYPDLVFGLPPPTGRGGRAIFRDGFGAWLGGIGGRLMIGSNALLLSLGGVSSADVIRFVITAKLVEMLTQQAWQVTDSGLVGLAQVRGSGDMLRVRELTRLMVRLALVVGGGAALVVLAFNPAFVGAWLGPDKFAGPDVNAVLAVLVVTLTLVHAQAAVASVLGRRLQVGMVNAFHGVVYAATTVGLVTALGPIGMPLAGIVIGWGVGVAILSWMVAIQGGVSVGAVASDAVSRWLPRTIGPLAAAVAIGWLPSGRSLAVAVPAVIVVAAGYVWLCRPLLADLPLPARLRGWAEATRLLPRPATHSVRT